MQPVQLAQKIVTALTNARINLTTESAAHLGVLEALTLAGIEHQSEVRLNARDRIDVLCGSVGVEIKVKQARPKIWNQLERYAENDQVEILILATGRSWPLTTNSVGGVPLLIADLSRGWL